MFGLLFVERRDNGSHIETVIVDHHGQLVNPSEEFKKFFDDDFDEAIELAKARATIMGFESNVENEKSIRVFIVKAFSSSRSNDHSDFLQCFIVFNKHHPPAGPILFLCLDYDHLLEDAYDQAVRELLDSEAYERFDDWFTKLRRMRAIHPSIADLDETHKASLTGLGNYEYSLIAMALFDDTDDKRVVIAEICDFCSYGKSFFEEKAQKYLDDPLKIHVFDVDSADKHVKRIVLNTAVVDTTNKQNDLPQLRRNLVLYFNIDELKTLCFDLGRVSLRTYQQKPNRDCHGKW